VNRNRSRSRGGEEAEAHRAGRSDSIWHQMSRISRGSNGEKDVILGGIGITKSMRRLGRGTYQHGDPPEHVERDEPLPLR
jgi:hypothetical protein